MPRFRILFRSAIAVASLSFMSMTVVAASPIADKPAYVLVSAPLFIDGKTEIPGITLNRGNYSIRVLDHLKDRFILRVDDEEGKALATFIGLHNPEFDPFVALHHQGPILWSTAPKGAAAMRGFSFPNGNTLEFV
jgi:hypothetical protein